MHGGRHRRWIMQSCTTGIRRKGGAGVDGMRERERIYCNDAKMHLVLERSISLLIMRILRRKRGSYTLDSLSLN